MTSHGDGCFQTWKKTSQTPVISDYPKIWCTSIIISFLWSCPGSHSAQTMVAIEMCAEYVTITIWSHDFRVLKFVMKYRVLMNWQNMGDFQIGMNLSVSASCNNTNQQINHLNKSIHVFLSIQQTGQEPSGSYNFDSYYLNNRKIGVRFVLWVFQIHLISSNIFFEKKKHWKKFRLYFHDIKFSETVVLSP